jgi:signal transduction histidine kinase/CheY-like chemotaxis protein/integral membrane sensor domain MASE1
MDSKKTTTLFEKLAQQPILGNLLLCVSYFLTGHIGLALAASPSFATLVWPASGIALAWVLLFGWRLLAGVLLGSFTVALFETAKSLEISVFSVNWWIPLAIGLGAAMQAAAGAWLIKRYVSFPDVLDKLSVVFKLLLLGGVLATLINATWSVGVLHNVGAIKQELVFQSWFIWWVGDSLGVLVFAPVLLVIGLPKHLYRHARVLTVTIVSAMAFLVSASVFLLAVSLESKDRLAKSDANHQQIMGLLQQKLHDYENFALFVRGFFEGSEKVAADEFTTFVSPWLKRHPEVQMAEWAPKVLADERQSWQQQQSLTQGRAVEILEKGGTQRDILLVNSRLREVYFPLLYLEPWPKNRQMLGFDIQTNEANQNLLEQSAGSGLPLLSAPIKLAQIANHPLSAILYTPIYKSKAPLKDWDSVIGFVGLVLKPDALLAIMHQEIIGASYQVLVKDKLTGQVLYGHEPSANQVKKITQLGLYNTSTLRIAQRDWRIDVWPIDEQLTQYQSWLTWLVLVLGLIGTSIAVSYTLVSTGQSQSLKQEIDQQTKVLIKRNQQLELARTEAEKANVAKSLFLANMSHEIRTPMNGVLGMAELLKETELNLQQQQYVQVIYASGKALISIINDILDYSKIEAGKMDIEQLDVDIEEILSESASIFALVAEQKGLEFLLSVDPNTPQTLTTDPTRLKQILLNLLSNAFKFTHQGQVIVRVYSKAQEDHKWLYVEVSDTGIGISPAQQQRLFDVFTQAHNATTRQFGGTGLGLSISKQLALLMNGQISLESELGKGTTFTLVLPYIPAKASFEQQRQQSHLLLKGLRVLLVDNSYEFGRRMVQQAQLWGMHIDVIHDGEYALLLMRKAQQAYRDYHVVILDGELAHIAALDIAKQIADEPLLEKVKCILLTSLHNYPSKQQLENTKIALAMTKPHSVTPVRDAILRILPSNLDLNNPVSTEAALQSHSALTGKRILLADDYMVNQMVLVAMLEKMALQVDVASNGKEAFSLYQDNPLAYSLVLMDCEMPEQDGYVTTQLIRDFEAAHHLRAVCVIALTAHAQEAQQQRCLQIGMNDFLSKPLAFQTLKTCLLKYL